MKERRIKDYYTLTQTTYTEFNKYIDANNFNKSKLLETIIKEYLSKISKNE